MGLTGNSAPLEFAVIGDFEWNGNKDRGKRRSTYPNTKEISIFASHGTTYSPFSCSDPGIEAYIASTKNGGARAILGFSENTSRIRLMDMSTYPNLFRYRGPH